MNQQFRKLNKEAMPAGITKNRPLGRAFDEKYPKVLKEDHLEDILSHLMKR